jgi:flavin-dependent thymidylate synthase
MSSLKYFNKVGEIYPYSWDKEAKVELWSGWNGNINQDSREEMVATIASLSYGNEQAKNPIRLYKTLQKLKHESVFEFIAPPIQKKRIESSLRHKNFDYFSSKYMKKSVDDLIEEHKATIGTFKLTIPIFVARQFMRHRCFSYLELSRRYVKGNKVPLKFYKHHYKELKEKGYSEDEIKQVETLYNETNLKALDAYNSLLNSGLKAEIARSVLPVATYTTMYVQGDVACLANFFALRRKEDAQEAIRLVADAMYELIKIYQPDLLKNIENYKGELDEGITWDNWEG